MYEGQRWEGWASQGVQVNPEIGKEKIVCFSHFPTCFPFIFILDYSNKNSNNNMYIRILVNEP